ncbi:MAG: Fe-S oxidoreductase [Candidatus Thorarchaeota archaeon]
MKNEKLKILLVEPEFPKPSKSKNHNDFMPIGLLKLAAYHRKKGDAICIRKGEVANEDIRFEYHNGRNTKGNYPDTIYVTSYFTYWAKYVKNTVMYYKELFPKARITVGGVYASLMPDHCKKYTGCDEVFVGVHPEAEKCKPAYRYLEKHFGPVDFQIIHTTRGCIRKCDFCGIFKIEPKFTYKSSIKEEIIKKKVIFYDNNLLANPHIEEILVELAYLKDQGKILWCESQSGLDGRIIEINPDLAFLLKQAGFKDIRISWDGPYTDYPHIKKQINILRKVEFNLKRNVFIFMIYNWDIPFEEMEKKRTKCWEWQVQISDCRYRPLNRIVDRYSGQKSKYGQTGKDYHIHTSTGWTDKKVRKFRSHIRSQNMCLRFDFPFYTPVIERNILNKTVTKSLIHIARNFPREDLIPVLNAMKIPYWFPESNNGTVIQMTKSEIYEQYQKETNTNALYKGIESTRFRSWTNGNQRRILKQLAF